METKHSEAVKQAYRIFSTWRRDLVAARFAPAGKPFAAYRALDAIIVDASADVPAALRAAEAALQEWVDGGNPGVVETCKPVLNLVQAQLADFSKAVGGGAGAFGRCSNGWYALPRNEGPCLKCGAIRFGICQAEKANPRG